MPRDGSYQSQSSDRKSNLGLHDTEIPMAKRHTKKECALRFSLHRCIIA